MNPQDTANTKKVLEQLLHGTCCLLGAEQTSARQTFETGKTSLASSSNHERLQPLLEEASRELAQSHGDAFRAAVRKLISQLATG